MNTLRTTLTAITLLISTSFGFAQSSTMKDPVSYTLKNGMTIVLAENESSAKVFANLSFEAANNYSAEKATVQQVMNTLLHQQLTALDTGLSYSDKGLNLAVKSADFESALQTMYTFINAPGFTQAALEKAKAEVLVHLTAQDKYFPQTVNTTSVANLSLADVNAYYNEINKPAETLLTVAGNINSSEVRKFTKRTMDKKPVTDTNTTKTYLAEIR